MKIKYITEEGLDVIKETLVKDHKKHLLDSYPDYFIEYFTKQGWLKESKYEFDDISFDSNPDYNISDPINIKMVFESLKNLDPVIAADERIWSGMLFSDMWRFAQFRRNNELRSGSDLDIKNSFLFMRGSRRSCFINCLSRLWWIAYILYDETNEKNPYELCEYFASRAFPSRVMLFSSTNFVSNPNIAKGIVQCHYDRFKEGKDDGRYPYSDLNKYFNCLGGISILDSLTRDEIYQKSKDFLDKNF